MDRSPMAVLGPTTQQVIYQWPMVNVKPMGEGWNNDGENNSKVTQQLSENNIIGIRI